jgi:hypothetical protein
VSIAWTNFPDSESGQREANVDNNLIMIKIILIKPYSTRNDAYQASTSMENCPGQQTSGLAEADSGCLEVEQDLIELKTPPSSRLLQILKLSQWPFSIDLNHDQAKSSRTFMDAIEPLARPTAENHPQHWNSRLLKSAR